MIDERWTILLADDDDIDRMAVRRALKSAGMLLAIEEARDSTTALAMLESNIARPAAPSRCE
jgi:CheY-like chemotaxis protein